MVWHDALQLAADAMVFATAALHLLQAVRERSQKINRHDEDDPSADGTSSGPSA